MSFLNDFNLFSFASGIKRPLILDGAMGSLLQHRGVSPHPSLWMSHANISYPQKVLSIHQEYIQAGADIITTNTFRTNPSASEHAGRDLVKAAVLIAKEAASGRNVLIAGSNAPAEDCYQRERTLSTSKLEYNHCKHIDLLIDSGVDFILNETQSHYDEIKIIAGYCARHNIPFIMSLFIDSDLNLLSGEKVSEVLPLIWEHTPLSIGFNCVKPEDFRKLKDQGIGKYRPGFYLNCGGGAYEEKEIKCVLSPEDYSSLVKDYLILNPSFVGACCGSSPGHIQLIRKLFVFGYEN